MPSRLDPTTFGGGCFILCRPRVLGHGVLAVGRRLQTSAEEVQAVPEPLYFHVGGQRTENCLPVVMRSQTRSGNSTALGQRVCFVFGATTC